MQPPETDPVTCPSARIASQEPTGRGDEPQVCTTVAIAICSPACSQATAVFKTLKSVLFNFSDQFNFYAST